MYQQTILDIAAVTAQLYYHQPRLRDNHRQGWENKLPVRSLKPDFPQRFFQYFPIVPKTLNLKKMLMTFNKTNLYLYEDDLLVVVVSNNFGGTHCNQRLSQITVKLKLIIFKNVESESKIKINLLYSKLWLEL